ncbi:MAG: S1 RNA-binding domain-containing protein, partial [Carnobacterium sp.]
KIDIDDEGLCSIFSSDQAAIDRAKEIIAELVREAKVGEIYDAKVVRIESFGAFVNLFGKQDAMVHISEMAWARTENVEDVVKLGDTVKVKIMKIDDKGRVDASMRALVEKPEGYVEPERKPRERRENGDRRKGNGNNRGNGFDRRNNDRNNQGNKVGNHSFERRERKSHIDEEFPELSTKKPE